MADREPQTGRWDLTALVGGAGEPAAPADPCVGLVAGPVQVTNAAVGARSRPDLVAAAGAALITMAAVAVRALTGDLGWAQVLAGLLVPALLVAGVAVAHRLAGHGGAATDVRFTLRATTGVSTSYTLRGDAPRDALQTHDLVRVVPGRRGRVRAVEVLATLNGPVVRRLPGRPASSPAPWLGFVLAAALLAAAAAYSGIG